MPKNTTEHGPHAPESSALTMRPPRLPSSAKVKVVRVRVVVFVVEQDISVAFDSAARCLISVKCGPTLSNNRVFFLIFIFRYSRTESLQ